MNIETLLNTVNARCDKLESLFDSMVKNQISMVSLLEQVKFETDPSLEVESDWTVQKFLDWVQGVKDKGVDIGAIPMSAFVKKPGKMSDEKCKEWAQSAYVMLGSGPKGKKALIDSLGNTEVYNPGNWNRCKELLLGMEVVSEGQTRSQVYRRTV
jgi:hypothetical protein